MAAPFITALVALMMQLGGGVQLSPREALERLSAISEPRGTRNLSVPRAERLYSFERAGGGATDTPTPRPSAMCICVLLALILLGALAVAGVGGLLIRRRRMRAVRQQRHGLRTMIAIERLRASAPCAPQC